jgi:pectin methylesterase-like acyl-CoA thioesterase
MPPTPLAASRLTRRALVMGIRPASRRSRHAALLVGAAATVATVAIGFAGTASAGTVFSDDFEDGNTSGWSKSGGTWPVVTDGSKVLSQSAATAENARLFAGTSGWTDYVVSARIKPLTLPSAGSVSLLARAAGATSYYRLSLLSGNKVQLQAVNGGTVAVLGSATRPVVLGTWYDLTVRVSGSVITGSIDGTPVASVTDASVRAGRIGVQTQYATAEYDDITVSTGSAPSPSATTPSPTPSTSPTTSPSPTTSVSPTPGPTTGPPVPGDSFVVAKDGSGTHTTVQAAVDAVPPANTRRVTIQIKPGTYRELVSIPSNKPFISLVGTTGNAVDVVITYDNASGTPKAGGGTYGTSGSASVTIDGNDFTAQHLTFSNSFDEAAHDYSAEQAVAVLTRADRLVFDNVRFLGNQDTLYHNSSSVDRIGRAYFRKCYIEGDVDFIFGRGTGVFDRCEIKSLSRGSSSNNGYVTAAATSIANTYGLLFHRCDLTSNGAAPGSVHLGRPWHPSGDVNAIAQVLYRESTLGAHIKAAPWTDMSGFSWKDARFSEYHNTGAGAMVNSDRPQLTDDQATAYTAERYLAGSDGWNPLKP